MATGILLTGYGAPDSLDAIGPFMKNLTGREPSPELLARVTRRYLSIGGSSPLTMIAGQIASALEDALDQLGSPMPVAVGMAYWDPYIADALAGLKEVGCDKVISVSLSPFESKIAHGAYRAAIDEAVERIGGLEVVETPLISTLDEYASYFAGATAVALSDTQPNEGIIIVFTAHSLPDSDLVDDDPYVGGLERVTDEIASKLGLGAGTHENAELLGGLEVFGSSEAPRAWYLAYQSEGARPGEWLGPDIGKVIEAVNDTEVKGLIVCPIGFMTDHMETMYDLDIVAAGLALDSDLEFVRVPVPNDHPMLIEVIAKMLATIA
jgi:ferrochelatase